MCQQDTARELNKHIKMGVELTTPLIFMSKI